MFQYWDWLEISFGFDMGMLWVWERSKTVRGTYHICLLHHPVDDVPPSSLPLHFHWRWQYPTMCLTETNQKKIKQPLTWSRWRKMFLSIQVLHSAAMGVFQPCITWSSFHISNWVILLVLYRKVLSEEWADVAWGVWPCTKILWVCWVFLFKHFSNLSVMPNHLYK